MSPIAKFLVGLAAALAAGWVGHGPAGQGEAFIDGLESRAEARLRAAGVEGVTVRMERDPLRRRAILSGPADSFQREGLGSYPGINDRILDIAGIAAIQWANPPGPGA